MFNKMVLSIDQEVRDKAREKMIMEEQNANNFSVDTATEDIETDFKMMGYVDLDHPGDGVEKDTVQPVDYWDNDDGFWDEYLQHRQGRMEDAQYLINRRYFIH